MTNIPMVSINMSCYNCSKFIKQSIESILNQTFTDFELIIVDDGSTDNSIEIIKGFPDKRIKLFENDINQGIVFSRNRAIEHSQGKYIAILDSDDIAYSTRLEKQVSFMELNPDFAMTGTWFDIIDENGEFNGEVIKFPIENKLIKTQLFFGNYFGQSTMMIRREIFDEFRYDKFYLQAEDYFLWVQIANKYKVANLQESLVQYRIHKKSITQSKFDEQESFVKMIFAYQLKYLKFFNMNNYNIDLHYNILRNKYILDNISWQTNKEILNWILELQKRNIDFKIFDENYFTNNLREYWKYYFSRSYLYGLKAIRYLFTPFNSTLTLKKKMIFVYKCFRIETRNKLLA